MKKTRELLYPDDSGTTRILRIMKLSFFLMFVILWQLSAHSYSQETRLRVDVNNASIKEVFKAIRLQSEFTFVFNEEDVASIDQISLNVENETVTSVLDVCLKNTGLSWQVVDNVIIIKPAEDVAVQEQVVVRGKVVDESGEPIPGVNIVLVENNIGTVTGVDGSYEIRLPDGKGTLTFSFIGFEKKVVTVNGQTEVNVQLKTEVSQLEDVVVTGMFVRKAETYTGSASVVTSEQLLKFGNRNLLTSLQSFDPSFHIVEDNLYGGDPNRLPDVDIRGNTSLPNVDDLKDETRAQLNTPLIIIDGFESTLRKLMDMDETEVESITLLKDASATAIYGSRAANGVVVVATKAPKSGRLTVSYRGDLTVNAPDLSSYGLLNARDKLELERVAGLYVGEEPSEDVELKKYYNFLLNEVNRGVDTYWLSKPLRTGIGERHSLRLEGGDKKFRYSGSVQYNLNKGVMKGSERNVLNGAINLSYIHKKFRFTNNLTVGTTRGDQSPYGSFSSYAMMNPYWRTHDDNGTLLKYLGEPDVGVNYSPRWQNLPLNPLYNATLHQFNYSKSVDVTENMSLIWDVMEGLKFTGSLGITKAITISHNFKPADHTDFADWIEDSYFRRGSYTYGVNDATRFSTRMNLSYNTQIKERHIISSGLNLSSMSSDSYNTTTVGEGFPNEDMDFLPAAMQYAEGESPGGSESLSRTVGLTSFLNYSFDNTYFADVSYRLDGSSQFGKKKRYAPFWSAGIGWNMHNVGFIKSAQFIDRLKLRGSVGVTGAQNFKAYQALSTYKYYTDDKYFDASGVTLLALGNDRLRWQQTLQYNIGIDLQVFKNRFMLGADYYIKTTDGMISSITIPLAHGFKSYVDNIGKVGNKGFEWRLTTYLIRNMEKNFTWSVTGSGAHNVNKIIEISEALKKAQQAMENAKTASPGKIYREGESISAIYAVRSLGIDPTNGKEVYLGRSGQPTYSWSASDKMNVGNTEPWMRGNISSSIRYKHLNINMSFGYQFGGQQYNQTLIDKVENADLNNNVDERVYNDRWKRMDDIARFKGLNVKTSTSSSTRFVQDDNRVTCKNINFSYELRSDYIQKLGLSVVTFRGNINDVFYTSTIKRERGISYPFDRQFSLGISAIF